MTISNSYQVNFSYYYPFLDTSAMLDTVSFTSDIIPVQYWWPFYQLHHDLGPGVLWAPPLTSKGGSLPVTSSGSVLKPHVLPWCLCCSCHWLGCLKTHWDNVFLRDHTCEGRGKEARMRRIKLEFQSDIIPVHHGVYGGGEDLEWVLCITGPLLRPASL